MNITEYNILRPDLQLFSYTRGKYFLQAQTIFRNQVQKAASSENPKRIPARH
jgi:hypothetical protein